MDPVLLILIAVSAFVLFRLFSVLGTRQGHEARPDFDPAGVNQNNSVDNDQDNVVPLDLDEPPRPVSTNERILREADGSFEESSYLRGAKSAYEMIVEAFASGDLRSIRPYLDGPVYEAFKGAVVERENAGHSADVKFVNIERAALVEASTDDDWMRAVTEFTSNQIRSTRDKDGNVIDGDENRIDLVKDRWTFARKRSSADPNWILVATGVAS